MRAARGRQLAAVLLLLQLLQGCVTIYSPDEEDASGRGPGPRQRGDDDDEGAGVITVHAGKRKPPSRSWTAAPPAPAVPPGCPSSHGRRRREAPKSKPLPVRERLTAKRHASNYHCPDSWKDLDFQEVQELECPENATGWFPFPPDCRKYLNCWRGRGFLQACAPATLFHPIRRECDYPEKVRCLPTCRSEPTEDSDAGLDGDPTNVVDPEDPDATSPLLDLRSAAAPLRRVPPPASAASAPTSSGRARRQAFARPPGAIQCTMEGGTGLAPHPVECSKFVNCWQGKPHIQNCAGSTYFNPRINACDFPHKVPECVAGKRDASRVGDVAGPPHGQQHGLHHGQQHGQQHGGYHQFGNQGYQPPPRQTFLRTPPSGDQVPAASSFQGYGPNQVLPPPEAKGKVLQPLQPLQSGAGSGRDDPNAGVEGIGWGGVAGPLPQGVSTPDVTRGQPPPHHHNHRPHSPAQPEGSYTPSPNYYNPNRGGYYPRPQSGNPLQPGGGYTTPGHSSGGGHTPSGGYGLSSGQPTRGYDQGPLSPHPPGGHGHNSQWHRDHGVPMPGGSHGPHGHTHQWHRDHGVPMPGSSDRERPESGYTPPATTPSYSTTTCAPESLEDVEPLDWDLDLRSGGSSNWIDVLERTKNSSMPQSGQMVRLRGGPTPLEGYVEVLGPGSRWGSVCDKPANWTVEEASIVCRTLGYERGAELAWQGRPRGSPLALEVHVDEVHCTGTERSLVGCTLKSGGDGCNVETQATGLRCYPNWAAKCRPGEVQFKGACYSVVIPRQDRKVDAIAFSQDEAIKHCKAQGGHLLDVNSQAESDFLSEWLTTSYPALGSVLTAGVGVAVPGRSVWVWEGSGAPLQYSLWWPGPPTKDHNADRSPKVGGRPLCILLKKDFPCDSWPGAPRPAPGRGGYGSWQGARPCAAEYFFWHAEDCAVRQRAYPYVCERKADDVGCLGSGEYEGPANVSWNGRPCVPWDSPAAVSTLRYRVTEDVRLGSLTGHNRCRRVGSQEPWCFVDAGPAGIREERCDIPVCRESSGNDAALGPSGSWPGLYQSDGRPRRPPQSRPFTPTHSPTRDADDPQTDPRGTGSSPDAPFPTLPTSRTFVGRPTTWPDPFAARTTTTRPFPTLPTSRTYQPAGSTSPPGPPGRSGRDPAADWPANSYAPDFSHREVDPPHGDGDYPDRPDPLTMPLQPRPLGNLATVAGEDPTLEFGARPEPSRGYGLAVGHRGGSASRPPVATARPPSELYSALRPGQSYGGYAPHGAPSYSNLFGLLPAIAADDGRYPSHADLEGRHLQASPGSSEPYSRVGYYPRPQDGAGDVGVDGVEAARDWPPDHNGHAGPGAFPGVSPRVPSRQSRTAEQNDEALATAQGTSTGAMASEGSATAATPPAFSRPTSTEQKSEHVMKIPRPGQLQVTTEKIFFM